MKVRDQNFRLCFDTTYNPDTKTAMPSFAFAGFSTLDQAETYFKQNFDRIVALCRKRMKHYGMAKGEIVCCSKFDCFGLAMFTFFIEEISQ